jgi:hypothetical protein
MTLETSNAPCTPAEMGLLSMGTVAVDKGGGQFALGFRLYQVWKVKTGQSLQLFSL